MISIIDFGSRKTPMISSVLNELEIDNEIIPFENYKTHLHSPDGFILSGAPILLTKTDAEPFVELTKSILNKKLPVLGICFGHQVIGMAYGASVYKGEEVREEIELSLEKDDALFSGIDEVKFMEDHTEGISLPADFALLASSKEYSNEAMKHNTLPFYGVQFHPEVSGFNGKMLIANFCREFGF